VKFLSPPQELSGVLYFHIEFVLLSAKAGYDLTTVPGARGFDYYDG